MKTEIEFKPTRGLNLTFIVISMFFLLQNRVSALENAHEYSFAVEKIGSGKPMILIPGLFCSGKVWEETVHHFKDRFTCYSITLPGFAGQKAIQSDSLLKTVAAQLTDYIVENNLKKPVIIGHSLSGVLALQIGESYPGLAGEIIIVSSAPFLPALSMGTAITLDSAKKIGVLIKNGMKNMTPDQIAQSQKFSLPTMIHDSAKIALVTAMAVKSDAYTQGEVMYELFGTDLRSEMKNIHCPVLALGDWIGYRQYGATRENVLKNYKDQFSLAEKTTIAINDSSYHFIMFDQPIWFYSEVEKFLGNQ
jgi:N-formylmaleamate deformylase